VPPQRSTGGTVVKESDARLKAYITDILKKDKTLREGEVKAAVRRGLKLGRAPLGAGVIREVRRKLGIDRPRAISYARNLLAKNPTLEAKKVIEDVGERFGISLAPPDVSHLRPADARRKKASQRKRTPGTKVEIQPVRKSKRPFGAVSITREGSPEDVARFFRSLAQ
jgi:hypothetical protein